MTELQTETQQPSRSPAAYPRKKRDPIALAIFIAIWLLLIGGGIFGAKWYGDHTRQQIASAIEAQTKSELLALQEAYDDKLAELDKQYEVRMTELTGKVDALNELLTFTKDNADSKTDNSNKLYTQLNEVKKQLNELKKNLDVLK
ncbi:hypothetical protein [Paenibacillus sp. IITD108]|uniref:hypothetical protein n=1 Tax=Paenibacillus sp. IITD108 TaxID=3116649 RepID=UPI002F4053A6